MLKSIVKPQPVYNGHPWEFGPTKLLRQVLLYYSFFSPFLLLCLIKDFHTNKTSLLNSKCARGMCSMCTLVQLMFVSHTILWHSIVKGLQLCSLSFLSLFSALSLSPFCHQLCYSNVWMISLIQV